MELKQLKGIKQFASVSVRLYKPKGQSAGAEQGGNDRGGGYGITYKTAHMVTGHNITMNIKMTF